MTDTEHLKNLTNFDLFQQAWTAAAFSTRYDKAYWLELERRFFHPIYKKEREMAQTVPNLDIQINKQETVDHPSHYGGDTIYEHVKVATAWGLLGNAFLYNCTKYLCRVGKKGNALEDLKKARWYLDKEIERISDYLSTSK